MMGAVAAECVSSHPLCAAPRVQAVAVGGLGCIVRVLTDRKMV